MSWWNLGGMNPNYKEFADKHPGKTMIGMAWAFQWRLMVLVFAIEILILLSLVVLGAVFGGFSSPSESATALEQQ